MVRFAGAARYVFDARRSKSIYQAGSLVLVFD
jgi:hypothetical protein